MNIRILIIDDEPRWLDFAQRDLGGFEIVIARDINTAIAELEEDQFDLVIASSGYLPILDIISQRFADKRVMVTTIKPSTQEALEAYRNGAVRYVEKSFSDQVLRKNVYDLVQASG